MSYETDEEQLDAIKHWWKRNYIAVLTGTLVIVLAWSGWTFYQSNKHLKAETASSVFKVMQISMQQGTFGDVAREGMKLLTEQPTSPYSAGVSFLLAKNNMQQNNTDEAIANLQWVVDNSTDSSLVLVAKLRMVNVLIDLNKLDEANNILGKIDQQQLATAEQANYAYAKAMVAFKAGDIDLAAKLLQQVVDNKAIPANLANLAQIQLNDLAR